jgi:hypothetical protein
MLWWQWRQCICMCLLCCVQWMNQRCKSETGAPDIPTESNISHVSATVSIQQLTDVSKLHTFSPNRAVNTPCLGYKNQSEMQAACSESHTKYMIKKVGIDDSNQIQDPTMIVAHLSSSCGCNMFWLRVQSCELDQSMKENNRTARACTVSVHSNSYLQCLMLTDNKIHLLGYIVLLYLIFRAQYWKAITLTSVAVPKFLCAFIYVT